MNNMKRILYIAPHCYPIKSSESICNSKVAYTLAKGGYCVDVYTCIESSTYPEDKVLDGVLRESDNLNISYVRGRIITRTLTLLDFIRCVIHYAILYMKTGYYYNGLDYSYQIMRKVKDRMDREGIRYDIMITRGFNTDYAGLYLHEKYGIPWIANWNDPYPTKRFPAPYGHGYEAPLPRSFKKLYNNIQKNIQIHTFPSDRLRNYMLKCFTNTNFSNTYVIHHMALSNVTVSSLPKPECFCLVHTGWVKTPRNPEPFLEALSNVARHYSKMQCIFIGGCDVDAIRLVRNKGLASIVRFMPAMTYSESLKYVAHAHLSVIIEAECEEGIYLPTKFVDSLQCGTPVFCVSPKVGTLHDITEKYRVGYSCDNSNIHDIENALRKAIFDYESNALPRVSKSDIPEFFDDFILEQYNRLFNSLLTGQHSQL